jgi:hypothetical protein
MSTRPYRRQAGSNDANRVCRDYFRLARDPGTTGASPFRQADFEVFGEVTRAQHVPD